MLIYQITNLYNNKIYIGKTTTDLLARWNLHLKHAFKEQRRTRLCNALRKYGTNNFTIEVVTENITNNDELNQLETHFIKQTNSINPTFGYNMTLGGDGGFTDEMREKSKITRQQQGISEEHKKALLKGRKEKGYRKLTDQERAERSRKMKLFYQNNPEHYKFICKLNQQNAKCGPDHPMWGKTHTEQTRLKLSHVRQGKTYEEIYGSKKASELRNNLKQQTNERNPNYSHIDKDLLTLLVDDPWIKRRNLCDYLQCSGPTLTKRFQYLLNIKNMQRFRANKTETELKTYFKGKLNEYLHYT